MAVIKINYIDGQGIDRSELDYTQKLPVNFIPTPRATGAEGMDQYYMRSWPGINKQGNTTGVSRGRIYNDLDKCVYQVCGTKLQKVTGSKITTLTTISGKGRVRMAYSDNSTAIVAGGKAYYWNGSKLTTIKNWAKDEKFNGSEATHYDLSNITDVTHNGKRYCFTQKNKSGFFITDLQNEQRPDELSAFYTAESSTDNAVGITEWRDLVVVMGTQSIQYFQLTGIAERVYAQASNYTLKGGITGTDSYTSYAGSIAMIGRQSGDKIDQPASIYIAGGGAGKPISSGFINKKLRQEADLSKAILENIILDSYNFILLKLSNQTFCYESSTKSWFELKDDIGTDSNYRGVDHIYDSSISEWTVGDSKESLCGLLSMQTSTRYGEDIEGFLWSQNMRFDDVTSLGEYRMDTIPGYTQTIKTMALAVIVDGTSYGEETWVTYSEPFNYVYQPIVRNFGPAVGQMTIAHRFLIDKPLCISNGRITVG